MIQESGEGLTNFSSDSVNQRKRKLCLASSASWFRESHWNGRGILFCMAELALVAISFLFTASFFANSGNRILCRPRIVLIFFLSRL